MNGTGKLALAGFLGLVVIPTVVGVTTKLINRAMIDICNTIHKNIIEKGLKDGSIVIVDGKYYRV